MEQRVALYLRVSTTRQAEKELSIPDQRRQAEKYCQHKGWKVITEFVEPGASATDDKRPAFQRMIDDASVSPSPFDFIVVHSFSRFFRDAYKFEFYRRKLAKHGVEVVSITQELGSDPMGDMVRQILNLFDECQSKENSKHVLRAMKENARQGFWNGATPPFGVKVVPVAIRADVEKKKLEIEPNEAAIVKRIFNLCLQGKGIRSIARAINDEGLRQRNGKLFAASSIHAVLANTAYKGLHHFNKKCSKTRKLKDPSEWIAVDIPKIIEEDAIDRVQESLRNRRPVNTPPRVVNGPTLLTGIVKCGKCGGGMTIRTGKGGRYRYYVCNNRISKGEGACDGLSIPMGKMDQLILSQLEERLFQKERIQTIIERLISGNQTKADELHRDEKRLRRELRNIETKIDRLLDAVADGIVGKTDGLRRKHSALEQQRDELLRQVSSRKRRRQIPTDALSPENVDRFLQIAREKLRDENSEFRKRYLRLFVDRIEVGEDQILIMGSEAALAASITGTTKPDTNGVPSFVQNWWARLDSNQQPDRYERPALTN